MDRRTLRAAAGAVASTLATAQGQTPLSTIKFRRAYADGPYGQIHYRYVVPAIATKTPLVCLHASPLSGILYENWIEEMGKDRNSYAPDTPGYGGSDTPPSPVQIPDFGRAIIRFMDEPKAFHRACAKWC
jgi:pimeloyl-ACP methyl ester carboxylesterase